MCQAKQEVDGGNIISKLAKNLILEAEALYSEKLYLKVGYELPTMLLLVTPQKNETS